MNSSGSASAVRRQIELLEIAHRYFGSQVLFTANELGVFGELADGPRSAHELAQAIGANDDALERLLNGCVALRLLNLDDGLYTNSRWHRTFSCPTRGDTSGIGYASCPGG